MLPRLYHAHHKLHSDDLPFWLDLAARQGDPILELGCGTGRVLIPLAEGGRRVLGLDRDPDMLAVLQEQAGGAIPIFQADMAAFRLAMQFSLIIMPCNTVSTLPPVARLAMMQRVREHLRPGGLFVASMPNPILMNIAPSSGDSEVEEFYPHPLDGEPVQATSRWRRTRRHFYVYWHYDHLFPDGRVERLTLKARHELTLPQGYLDDLRAARLFVETPQGNYDGSPYRFDCPYLILMARRMS